MSEKTLYLLRGLPGAGKSTLAKTLSDAEDAFHFEADMYFDEDGVYIFEPTGLYAAHQWCLRNTEQFMLRGRNVVVSNTFTTDKELKPYLELAAKTGHRVVSLIVENRHGNVSVHDVPEETLAKMRARFTVKL